MGALTLGLPCRVRWGKQRWGDGVCACAWYPEVWASTCVVAEYMSVCTYHCTYVPTVVVCSPEWKRQFSPQSSGTALFSHTPHLTHEQSFLSSSQ